MITNPLLEANYKVQKQLGEEARHDIRKYVENSHRIVLEAEKKYGFKFNYGEIQGGSLDPPTAQAGSASSRSSS